VKAFEPIIHRRASLLVIGRTDNEMKLLIADYAILTKGTTYVELGQQVYEQRFKERRLVHLKSQAKSLGFQLVPCET
jgi:hypothetical protein